MPDATTIIDVREGETDDEASERHVRELANARAAIARVDRVLETGRLEARANGYRESAMRLRGVVASSVIMLRRRFPCTDALTGTLPALINHAARDVELSEQYERRLAEVERLRAEVDCGQEGVCAKPPGCARHWQERNQELASEVAKLKERSEGLQQAGADLTLRLLALEKARDLALASSRAWCEKAAELQAGRDETLAWQEFRKAAYQEAARRLAAGYRETAKRLAQAAEEWSVRLEAERDSLMKQRTALTRDLSWWVDHALDIGAERDRAVKELDGYKEASRRLRLTANTQDRLLGRLRAERDCAVARAKELEAALKDAMGTLLGIYNSCVVALDEPGPQPLANHIRPRAKAAASKLGEALHPPPPASASDRTGTEHHDAADPEDGCQAGARRP